MAEYGSEEHFRLVLSEVAAIYPRPERDATAEVSPDTDAEEENEPKKPAARIAIEELEEHLGGEARITQTYCITVLISAFVAALGLMRDNTAVVIGAMVIAPLLSPNMSLALGTTLGKLPLARGAAATVATGISLAFAFALLLGAMLEVDPGSHELASRTTMGYSDVALALASGVAGAIAVTTGVPAALVGVMVAVALMPPLVASGLLIGAGHIRLGVGAALLTGVNVIAVNLAAVLTFAAKGIKPRDYWEAGVASRMTRLSIALWLGLLLGMVGLIWLARHAGQSGL